MWRLGMLLCGLSLAGCGTTDPGPSSAFDSGPVDAGAPQDASWVPYDAATYDAEVCEDVIDLVFALDVSSSMEFILDKLGTEIDSVVTAATALAPNPHFGLIAFVDNYQLDDSGPLEGGKVHTDGATLKTAFQYYKNTYTTPNRNPGDGPTGPTLQNPICEENSLDALGGAATSFPWRETATRVVIVVTDDTFLERPDNYGDRDGDGLTNQTNFPREGDYPAQQTLAEVVAALRNVRTRVFSFTRLGPPGPLTLSKCSTGRRLPWAAVSDGWTTPYLGQAPIPTQTAGKNFDIELVRAGQLSLSATINEVVLESYCTPIIY